MEEAAKSDETPLLIRIVHWIFHRCTFGNHTWKEPTKESNLAECTACGYMPVCQKHRTRLFVHGYDNNLGCIQCQCEFGTEYLKRSGQKQIGVAETYTSKFKEGLVFYVDNATEEEIEAQGWKRSVFCGVHEKANAICGCVRFYREEVISGKAVLFTVRMNTDTNRPRTLGFEVKLTIGGTEARYGDYREIKGHMHFDKLYIRFLEQADELIKKYG